MVFYDCYDIILCVQSHREPGGAAQRFGGYKDFANGIQPSLRTHESMKIDAAKAERRGTPSRGVTGTSPLFRLPYFDVVRDTLLDMMHIGGGVVGRHLVGMLTGDRINSAIRSMNRSQAQAQQRRDKEEQKEVARNRAINKRITELKKKIKKAKLGSEGRKRSEKILAELLLGGVVPGASDEEEDEPSDEEEKEAESHVSACELTARMECYDLHEIQCLLMRFSAFLFLFLFDSSFQARLILFLKRWNMPDSTATKLDEQAFQRIMAPVGVAPRTKRPFTVPSQMTTHHWLNFTKVYGKYLLQQVYEGEPLRVLCELLDFVKGCILSELSETAVNALEMRAKRFAKDFDRYFPPCEQSVVLHSLVFHMPATLKYWGPARGYWCFPYERSALMDTSSGVCVCGKEIIMIIMEIL